MLVAPDHRRVRMPEKLANGVQRNTRLHQSTSKVMAQIVEAEILQLRSFFQSPPRAIDPFQPSTSYARKDPRLPVLGKFAPRLKRRERLGIADLVGYAAAASALQGASRNREAGN